MGRITVDGIRLYAYHGCMEEEAKLGGNYQVDVSLETDFSQAADKDDLSLTVDYVRIYDIVKAEMAIRSKLIESVAKRISVQIRKAYPGIKSGEVKVTKLNVPIGGVVSGVSVTSSI